MIFSKTTILALAFFLVKGTSEASLRGNVDTEERGLAWDTTVDDEQSANDSLLWYFTNVDQNSYSQLSDGDVESRFSDYLSDSAERAKADLQYLLDDFHMYNTGGCKDKNSKTFKPFTSYSVMTLQRCASYCLDRPKCVSFEYTKDSKRGSARCALSEDCKRLDQTVEKAEDENLWFLRK
mmetsp:Transcript_32214/g.36944  ORF Transcript_32214/g.36944 Transcript_32214/m.36944 type:complete len:180 (-) Transcript_32214:104-643(-)